MTVHLESPLRRQRWTLLVRLDSFLDAPMSWLAFIWLLLTVVDLVEGLGPLGQLLVNIIWSLFGLHFLIEFLLAPDKLTYFKHRWLTAISLLLPALRIFRVYRALRGIRFLRGSNLVRILSSINRGMTALSKSLGRKGLGYVLGLTCLIILGGAAGIKTFEASEGPYFDHFGTALWWTCMMVTTMGSDYFPKSPEGRLLGLLLAVYGFAIFGYVTATVASFFVEKEASNSSELVKLRREVRELKESLVKNQARD